MFWYRRRLAHPESPTSGKLVLIFFSGVFLDSWFFVSTPSLTKHSSLSKASEQSILVCFRSVPAYRLQL